MTDFESGIQAKAIVGASIEASVRRNLALAHLQGAARFAREANSIQNEAGANFERSHELLRGYVIGCVMMCVAGVEANFNEVMADDEAPDWFLDLIERRTLIERHNFYLAKKSLPAFENGKAPTQNVQLLVRLRNALVHYRPEWDDAQIDHGKLASQLRSAFELSPFLNEGSAPTFPVRCMSYGCAQWAVESALAFVGEFDDRLGRPNRTESFCK